MVTPPVTLAHQATAGVTVRGEVGGGECRGPRKVDLRASYLQKVCDLSLLHRPSKAISAPLCEPYPLAWHWPAAHLPARPLSYPGQSPPTRPFAVWLF